jgi:hypothetical protein
LLSQIHRTLPAAPLHNRAFGVRIADKHHAALADNADLLAVGEKILAANGNGSWFAWRACR